MPDVAALEGLDFPRAGLRIGGHHFSPPRVDKGITAMLTASAWVIQRLPGQVVESQRAELIRTLAEARNLTVEVGITPAVAVRVKDGQRLLVEIIPAGG